MGIGQEHQGGKRQGDANGRKEDETAAARKSRRAVKENTRKNKQG